MVKSNTKEFIEKAIKIHKNKYDYSKVNYIGAKINVLIICSIHGEFQQLPTNHLNGYNCRKCGIKKRSSSTENFIKKAIKIHGNIYDYSKVNYVDSENKIIIICNIHGEFNQMPRSHLEKHGCMTCGKRSNTEDFIKKAIKIHGNKYDYSKSIYITAVNKLIIICKIHGEFKQEPNNHLHNNGCSKCVKCYNYSTKEFIEKANIIHKDKYEYSKTNYINTETKIIIICKIHGEFEQNPSGHLNGRGCSKCIQNAYSKISINWLDFLSKYYNTNIQHALNSNEFNIPNTKYKADGYYKETNTIYEFHGDFWHGNPKLFNKDELNTITKTTFGELYNKTLEREEIIKNEGFNLITIWENDWKKINKSMKILQQKFRSK